MDKGETGVVVTRGEHHHSSDIIAIEVVEEDGEQGQGQGSGDQDEEDLAYRHGDELKTIINLVEFRAEVKVVDAEVHHNKGNVENVAEGDVAHG